MVHPFSEYMRTDEKGEKRLDSLEQRTIEVENKLLRTSNTALEKRVAELEASLRESNEECNKLRQTISRMEIVKKDVIPSKKDDSIDEKDSLIDDDNILDSISSVKKEEEIIYDRIVKLIENMKSDCQKAINAKVPTESQLPTRQGSRSGIPKSPSPTDGLISPKIIARSRTPISVITSNIPTSRAGTPSGGAISPPNTSYIPTKSPSSPNKSSHIPSRSNTPSSQSHNIPVTSLNRKQRQVGSCFTKVSSRPSTPPPTNISTGGISSGIPSYRRTVTC